MKYPFRYPFANIASRLGITVTIKVEFIYDPDAHVFVATSKDIPGLVLESDSFEALVEELREAIPNLLSMHNGHNPKKPTDITLSGNLSVA